VGNPHANGKGNRTPYIILEGKGFWLQGRHPGRLSPRGFFCYTTDSTKRGGSTYRDKPRLLSQQVLSGDTGAQPQFFSKKGWCRHRAGVGSLAGVPRDRGAQAVVSDTKGLARPKERKGKEKGGKVPLDLLDQQNSLHRRSDQSEEDKKERQRPNRVGGLKKKLLRGAYAQQKSVPEELWKGGYVAKLVERNATTAKNRAPKKKGWAGSLPLARGKSPSRTF